MHNDLWSSPPPDLMPLLNISVDPAPFWGGMSEACRCAKYIVLISARLILRLLILPGTIETAVSNIISRIYAHGKSVHWSCRILKRRAGRHGDPCKIYCNHPDCGSFHYIICCKFSFCCFLQCWFCQAGAFTADFMIRFLSCLRRISHLAQCCNTGDAKLSMATVCIIHYLCLIFIRLTLLILIL